MAKKQPQSSAKISKHRSPNYPAIALEDAIGFAKAIQTQGADRHFIPLSVAFDTWKYKEGWGNQIAAALKAYGLTEVKGKTDKREIKITEDGRRIILDAPEKEELLKYAALRPAIHAELWTKYRADPPADPVLKNYLVVDRFFNRNFVDSFISQFRKTIAYAGLNETDILPDEETGEIQPEQRNIADSGQDSGKPMLASQVKNTDKSDAFTAPSKGQLPFPLYLSKTQKAVLYVPAALTQAEYEELKRQINHSLDVVKIATVTDEVEPKS